MRTYCCTSSLVFSFLFHLILSTPAAGEDPTGVPPFHVSQQALLKLLKLGDNTKFDVPALYVFGDSIIDSGNNNFLETISKANYSPFGVDFDGGKATGRFTNGRTQADFIAQAVGLPLPPPFLGLSENMTLKTGVNYGSSSSGILPYDHNFLGKVLSLDQQIDFFEITMGKLKDQFNSSTSFANYLSKSLFLLNTGNNDMGIVYDAVDLKLQQKYNIPEYAKFVSQQFSQRLKRLYKLGARKFLVNSVGPLGCLPTRLSEIKPKTPCVEEVNKRAILYNNHLSELLPRLQSTLMGSKFVYGNIYKTYIDVISSPTSYGITDVRNSCCVDQAGNQTRPCTPNVPPCNNRNQHLFFDPFHPTEAAHFIFAKRCLTETSVCNPINLAQLLQA